MAPPMVNAEKIPSFRKGFSERCPNQNLIVSDLSILRFYGECEPEIYQRNRGKYLPIESRK